MASNHKSVILAFILVVLPSIVIAKEFIVGDEAGWTIGFDYQAWAKGKDFRVGDKLVFQYPVGTHNVFKVNGTAFQDCVVPPQTEALTTGNDTIVLATPGRKWYICGVGQHCKVGGQKLLITVQTQSPAPAPALASWSYSSLAPAPASWPYSSLAPAPAPWAYSSLGRRLFGKRNHSTYKKTIH